MRLTLAAAMLVLAAPANVRAADASWDRLAGKLRGVSETYKKWGITFDVKQSVFSANPDFCPSKFGVSGGMESPDTFKLDVEAELGRKEALAVGISGTYKIEPNGKDISGKGAILVEGSGASYKFTYKSTEGYSFEAGLEETFYSLGVKVGGNGMSPLNLGLKLGPVGVSIDPVKWVQRCKLVGPDLARMGGQAACDKVGGVLIRTDLAFMAAALSKAPPPSVMRLRDVTAVSLKRLLREGGEGQTLGPITTVTGICTDAEKRDVMLMGRVEPGMPLIPTEVFAALLRAIWQEGKEPFVSLDPAGGIADLLLKPRIGGMSSGTEQSALVARMLEADYRIKGALFGDIEVIGLTPIPTALSRNANAAGAGSARFWFTPRPLKQVDIGVLRTELGVVATFEAEPMLLTERAAFGMLPESPAGLSEGPIDGVLRRAAAEVTRAYPELERSRPDLQLKELRQVFELATACAVLRIETKSPSDACARLLKRFAQLSIPSVAIPNHYMPAHKSFPSPTGAGDIQIWGGVNTGATGVSAACMRTERTLASLAERLRSVAWTGASAECRGALDPAIADAERLDRKAVAQSHVAVAEEYLRKGSFAQAAAEADRAIELDAANARAHCVRANVKFSSGNRAEALVDLAEAIRLAPSWADPHIVRGVLTSKTDPAAAVSDFSRALKSAPRPGPIHGLRGLVRLKTGDKTGALADFSDALRYDPNDVAALDRRAELSTEMADFHAALDDRRRAAEIKPTAERVRLVALALLNVEDREGAIAEATRAIRIDPQARQGISPSRACSF